MILEELIDDSTLEDRITKNAARSRKLPTRERRIVFVHRVNFERLALFALFLISYDMASALEAANSEVALDVVAFYGPALFRMVVYAELTIETSNTEVDRLMVIDATRHFCCQ